MILSLVAAILFIYCGIIIITELYVRNDKNPLFIYSFSMMFILVGILFIIDFLNLLIVRFENPVL